MSLTYTAGDECCHLGASRPVRQRSELRGVVMTVVATFFMTAPFPTRADDPHAFHAERLDLKRQDHRRYAQLKRRRPERCGEAFALGRAILEPPSCHSEHGTNVIESALRAGRAPLQRLEGVLRGPKGHYDFELALDKKLARPRVWALWREPASREDPDKQQVERSSKLEFRSPGDIAQLVLDNDELTVIGDAFTGPKQAAHFLLQDTPSEEVWGERFAPFAAAYQIALLGQVLYPQLRSAVWKDFADEYSMDGHIGFDVAQKRWRLRPVDGERSLTDWPALESYDQLVEHLFAHYLKKGTWHGCSEQYSAERFFSDRIRWEAKHTDFPR